MKYRNNLSNVSNNSVFEVTKAFEVYIPAGQYDSNSYFGSSKLIGVAYQRMTLQPGDYLYDTFGGVFVAYNGKHYAVKMQISDKHPFEKTYGNVEEIFPIENLKLIPNAEIKLNLNRDLPNIPAPSKGYVGRSIDSIM